ncbi:hypothetical protein RHGRI_023452 [Rhododendron griersonianum]|uniref:Protein kinase domain-containing protein n=1 Tax=Rhododendron griersonianum TaxID=479676 RepID=A0AAV6J5W6_9ERIC|nr:hypothetical protein RHGRI_023452 [Rhododendron griersonianum]
MGTCCSKDATRTIISANGNTITVKDGPNPIPVKDNANPVKDIAKPSDKAQILETQQQQQEQVEAEVVKRSPFFPFYSPTPAHYLLTKNSPPAGSPAMNPKRIFKRTPSPAKHIRAALARRQGKPNKEAAEGGNKEGAAGGGSGQLGLDKSFGYKKGFENEYEMGEEIGKGHFGYTCKAKCKKGELKGQEVAVKVIPKAQGAPGEVCMASHGELSWWPELADVVCWVHVSSCVGLGNTWSSHVLKVDKEMTTAIAIEDARREVKILRALTGHNNLVKLYDAFEDHENVYIVMELCEGGELLDRILSRGGKYTEDDAKAVLIQILNFVSFCHLQGVVHRDLKPENFLFTSKEENSQLKAIDFGLSDFVMPDERLNDIVGSAYYVAPEVLHRSYSTEADVWSIGIIAYILLCGSRPFWARTESGIFRAVLKADPCFDEPPWPSLSSEAKDFVKCLLNKDPRKRMTAVQALS